MNYWIDWTDIFLRGPRQQTGIQRVVVGVSLELLKKDSRVKLFTFNKEKKQFFEVILSPRSTPSKPEMSASRVPFSFSRGDCVILLGATWSFTELTDELKKLKEEQELLIYNFVHDTTATTVPQYYHQAFPMIFKNWIRTFVAPCSQKLITNSKNSLNDINQLLKEMRLKELPIQEIRLADKISETIGSIKPSGVLSEKAFFLCVSTLEPRKNHVLLYYVWNLLLDKFEFNKIPPIYLVGGKGWNNENIQFQIANHPLLKQKIIHLENINDSGLLWLYQNCLATLYPAKYEGWGLPVAESLALGKYCIASSSSSIPEIGQDLIDYHNPYSTEELLHLVTRAIEDKEYVAKKNQEIKKCYKITNWDDTASEMWGFINS